MKIVQISDTQMWKDALEVSVDVYKLTFKVPFKNDFVMVGQIRRSALSINSNMSEGFDRNGNKQFIQFLKISKASLEELRTQLLISYRIEYLSQEEFENLDSRLSSVSKQIGGFIKYLKENEKK